MMEQRGFATVALALIRYQAEQVRPPRSLWTPFQLGRPLGEPEDPAFQRRVLLQALGLLERTDGPVILDDFPDDPPGWQDRPRWQPPVTGGPGPDGFAAELAQLLPIWHTAQARFGRTTVGLSGQPPEAWPGTVAAALQGTLAPIPPHPTGALSLRFLADDIHALYSEAAQATGPAPASRQIDTWFFQATAAGQALVALRTMALASSDEALKTIGTRFLVPSVYLPK